MVFYRKYRPQTLDELDSKSVREMLSAVLSSNVAHAFLFTGPKGLGKTSAARIVAKVVNCEKIANRQVKSKKLDDKESNDQRLASRRSGLTTNDQLEPCNQCETCISITNGTNLDVLELDAASNRGIDEIRSLRETIKLAPFQAQKKVYIIDEVHMLTTEAFNALLKTLEEPPPHAMFILCTTEPHKVPETIISRCQHISFSKASDAELVRSFQRVVNGENLVIEPEALLTIAKLSDGAFRDGVKTLEEIVLLAQGKKITNDLIDEKYKVITLDRFITDMLEHLIKRDARSALLLVSKIMNDGIDIKYFVEQLINALHGVMLAEVGIKNDELKIPKGFIMGINEIKDLVEILSKAHGEIKFAVLPQLPLELAIVEWTMLSRHSGKPEAHPESVHSKGDSGQARMTEEKTRKKNDSITDFWQQFIEKTKSYNHSLAGVLRSCQLKQHDAKHLVIKTPYTFHKQKLEERKAQELLEKVYEEVTGKKGGVLVELKSRE